MDEYFKEGGLLSSCLSGFEARSGQIEMAAAVKRLLFEENSGDKQDNVCGTLVVEAETGIGKTLAYLIPAALSGKRVIISTATLNLQDQLINKDIPLVEKIINSDLSAISFKGRQNYLCLYRWFQFRSNPQLSLLDNPLVSKIDSWLNDTVVGDRAELDWLHDKSPLWPKISSYSNQCLGGDCPESASCYINLLRKRAGSARLIIVNHHLFFSDLVLRKNGYGELLPRYEAVIFDEAHHLENVASTFFGKSFSQYQLLDLLSDLERAAKSDLLDDRMDELLATIGGLKRRTEEFSHLFGQKTGRFALRDFIDRIGSKRYQSEIEFLAKGLENLQKKIEDYVDHGEVWRGFGKRATELNENLCSIGLFPQEEDAKFVHWYEKRERSLVLLATPIEVAAELKENLYSSVRSCILTSATLSTGGNFSYIKERLGLADSSEFLQFSSPFDYSSKTMVYVPESGFPEPSSPQFYGDVCANILEILKLSRGRALVLFTSFKGMDTVALYLEDRLDYSVLVQGSASRSSLLKKFREETNSVLLAVASFWEGVDVAGETLSCVIIEKLPFEVPSDPVIQARIKSINDRDGKPFFEFQVPRAILTLRQGVGRLMRSSADRGVIAIMDVRLFSKGYGRTFLRSLPPSPVSRDMTDVAGFFKDRRI